ncbi:lamin-B1-like [Antedon mediterranea]|uniref:lamin-B1-like n=1 Tax=Antedon mediterranea TaxID=105859 RepID=UPI003AF80DDB
MASQTRSQKTTTVRKEYRSSSTRSPGTPLSPTQTSRHQEKEDLVNLNNRLAVYIDKIHSLEVENSGLQSRVTTIVEEHTQEITSIKGLYEAELNDARRLLDETSKEKARLEIDVGRYSQELDEFKGRFHKLEKEHASTMKKMHNLEGSLADKDARLKSIMSENRQLESENNDLKKNLQNREKQLTVAKKQVEEETVLRVDLENRLQSLKEELAFKQNVYKEELTKSRTRRQEDITEIDNRRRVEYESLLVDRLEDIREEHEEHIENLRVETEKVYIGKLDDLKRIAEQQRKTASAAQEELREVRLANNKLEKDKAELDAEIDALNKRIKSLEKQNKENRDNFQLSLNDRDDELSSLREQIREQLSEYEILLATKVSLDAELAAYNNLLEAEEVRLNITPSPPRSQTRSQKRASARTQTPIRQLRAKRRRVQDASSLVQSDHYSGSVSIADVCTDGKFIKLKNNTETDQALGGWLLKCSVGNDEVTYKFGSKYVLKADQEVTVWSSGSGHASNPPSDLVAKNKPSWGTGDEVSATLQDNTGEAVATRSLKKEYSYSDNTEGESSKCILM